MKRLSALIVASAALAAAQWIVPHVEAQAAPAAPQKYPPIVIVGFETYGAGCPPMSIDKPFTQGAVDGGRSGPNGPVGRNWIGLSLPDFFANVSEETDLDTRSCLIRLHVEAEAGYRTTVTTVKFAGTAALGDGVVAQLDATYKWSNQPATGRSLTPHRIVGPSAGDFIIGDEISASQPSLCASRETFEVNANLTLRNALKPAAGSVIVSEADVEIASSIGPLRRPAGQPVSVWIETIVEPCRRSI